MNLDRTPSTEIIEAMQLASTYPLLKGLSSEHLQMMKECATIRIFRAGDLILKQGDQADSFYLIMSGTVTLSHAGTKGNVPIQSLDAGDALGWSWLFPPYAWHFNAMAIEPTRTLRFEAETLRNFCKTRPDFGYEIMSRIALVVIDRLQKTRKKLFKLSSGF